MDFGHATNEMIARVEGVDNMEFRKNWIVQYMRKYYRESLIEQKVDLSREKDEHLKVTSLSTTKCLRSSDG